MKHTSDNADREHKIMRFVRYLNLGVESYGLLNDDEIMDLQILAEVAETTLPSTMEELIDHGEKGRARKAKNSHIDRINDMKSLFRDFLILFSGYLLCQTLQALMWFSAKVEIERSDMIGQEASSSTAKP